MTILPLLEHPAAQALGFTLLHFLWQDLLVGALLWMALRLLRAHPPSLQYGVACAALAIMLVVPVVTWSVVWQQLPAATPVSSTTLAITDSPPAEAGLSSIPASPAAESPSMEAAPAARYLSALLPYVLLLWAAGVLALMARLAVGWGYTRLGVARGGIEPPEEWMERFESLARRMGINRSVRFRVRRDDVGPCVIGWLRPVVLVPLAMLSGIPVWQMEAILAHELAHIRRHDYAVNLLQSVAETLLFYHPVVWWVSRQIRLTREFCCDEEAAAVCGDGSRLARALVSLESMRISAPALAAAAGGGSLSERVERLVRPPAENGGLGGGSGLALAVTAGVLILLGACDKLVAPELADELPQLEVAEEHVAMARQILAKYDDHEKPVLELFALLEEGNPNTFEITRAMYSLAKDESLRRYVVLVFPKIGTYEAAGQLIMIIRNDPSRRVRDDAVRGLGRMGDLHAGLSASALREAALDAEEEVSVRRSAVEVLGRMQGQHEFLQELIWRNEEPVSAVARTAIHQFISRPAELARIVEQHADEGYRMSALSTLSAVPGSESISLLERFAAEGATENVRLQAWRLLLFAAMSEEEGAEEALDRIDSPEVRRFREEFREVEHLIRINRR